MNNASVNRTYPFTAIVGQEDMKLALMLAAVQPSIGGVLITGVRGTAKTTAVRALPGVLTGDRRVIELPLNASEDRVVGTLELTSLMKTGERQFVPGLLAEADGQILYVDEINLLEDHIVDLLLDAAATGTVRIEREGVSRAYPSRFVLIGTMNPEEGTIRPQLLDRFGLSVRISGDLTKEERMLLIRRQIAFESNPDAFCGAFAGSEMALKEQIRAASELYPDVAFSDDAALFASGLCAGLGVDGYRGDITLMRASRAAAALDGRTEVLRSDILRTAGFVLPHRMKKLPFEEITLTDSMIEKAAQAIPPLKTEPAAPDKDADNPQEGPERKKS